MKLRIYIAAKLARHAEANALAKELKTRGYEVVSAWHGPHAVRVTDAELDAETGSYIATDCYCRVMLANAFVALLSPMIAGTLVEFGIAAGLRLPIALVGSLDGLTPMLRIPGLVTQLEHVEQVASWCEYVVQGMGPAFVAE